MGLSANICPVRHIDEQSKRSEIVLDLVDRFFRPGRRRPIELRPAGCRRVPLELLVVRDLADDGAHDVEDVERGHARAGATDVETRIGQPEAIDGGADRQPEQEPLGLGAIVLHDEARAGARRERFAHLECGGPSIEEQRILAQLLREEPLGKAGHEHDLERAPAGLMRAADEDTSIAVGRRLLVERAQPFGEDVARLLEPDRADGSHRAQLAEHAQHARRPAQHPRRQLAEALEPLAPGGVCRPGGERLDDGQREVRQVCQVLAIALEADEPRRLGIFAQALFLDPCLVAFAQTAQPAPPALGIAADDRGLDDHPLPLPRRAQSAFDDGGLVVAFRL